MKFAPNWLSRRALIWCLAASIALNCGLAIILLDDYQFRSYGLLHPAFSRLSDEDSQLIGFRFSTNHGALHDQLKRNYPQFTQGTAGLYFEMLNNGGSVGINENLRLIPGSLRKIPLLAATMKGVEQGRFKLSDIVVIQKRHLDLVLGLENAVGPLAAGGAGQKLTIRQLIEAITTHSDNTATTALLERVGHEPYADAMFAMGISWKTWRENFEGGRMIDFPASTYEFAQLFHALYFSSYLRPKHSQTILDLLGHSEFHDGLPAGVPPGVMVAHKTGDWRYGEYHHDCGIIYYPEKNYALCIMIKGIDKTNANKLISEISRDVFSYVQSAKPFGLPSVQ